MTYLKQKGMGKFGLEAQILEETEMLMEHLEEEGIVDPSTTLTNFTSNNIMRMMFSQRWQYGDADFEVFTNHLEILHANGPDLILTDLVPMFRHLPYVKQVAKEVSEAVGHIRNFFWHIIEKQIAEKDSLEAYLQTHQTMDEKEINNLVDLCQDMFLAGTDTTSTTLNYVIVHLLNNPSWQEELFHEIKTAFQGGVPSMEDLEKLPKLEATIQETLRLNPNGPLILRATAHATKVRNYVVPANCQVWVNVYHINYDPTTFPDPTAFSPERWLRPDGTFRREYPRDIYLSFSRLFGDN